jgi:hypothetical protein
MLKSLESAHFFVPQSKILLTIQESMARRLLLWLRELHSIPRILA